MKKHFIVYDGKTGKVEESVPCKNVSDLKSIHNNRCTNPDHRFLYDFELDPQKDPIHKVNVDYSDGLGRCSVEYQDREETLFDASSLKGLPILIEGLLGYRTGYSVLTRELCKNLIDSDLDVRVLCDEEDPFADGASPELMEKFFSKTLTWNELLMEDDLISFSFHHPYLKNYRKKYNILYTMIESYTLNEKTIQSMDSCYNKFIVPTRFVQNVITQYVDPSRVEYAPMGIDLSVNHPDIERCQPLRFRKFDFDSNIIEETLEKPSGLKFLYAGRFSHRKGTDLALQAFMNEFDHRDDVSLVMFVLPEFDQPLEHLHSNIHKILSKWRGKNHAPIFISDRSYSDKERSLPYSWGDVFLFPSRGEGFGLTPMEAAACGLPLVCSDNSGLSDFISDETAYVIPADKIEDIGRISNQVYHGNYPEWRYDAFHDHMYNVKFPIMNSKETLEQIGKTMRHVYNNFGCEEMQRKSSNISNLIKNQFTWDHGRNRIYEVLKGIVQ